MLPKRSWTNRERQCAPTSPYRREVAGLTITPPPGGPPFVHNHLGELFRLQARQKPPDLLSDFLNRRHELLQGSQDCRAARRHFRLAVSSGSPPQLCALESPVERRYCTFPFLAIPKPALSLQSALPPSQVWPSTIQYDLNPDNESSFRQKGHKLLWRGSPDGIGVAMHEK